TPPVFAGWSRFQSVPSRRPLSSHCGRTKNRSRRAQRSEISSGSSPPKRRALRGWPSRTSRSACSMSQTPEFTLGDEFARVLTETTMSLVCVLDQHGRILFFNEACERTTGYKREEVVGCDARDYVIPPEEIGAFTEVLAYIWSTGLS